MAFSLCCFFLLSTLFWEQDSVASEEVANRTIEFDLSHDFEIIKLPEDFKYPPMDVNKENAWEIVQQIDTFLANED